MRINSLRFERVCSPPDAGLSELYRSSTRAVRARGHIDRPMTSVGSVLTARTTSDRLAPRPQPPADPRRRLVLSHMSAAAIPRRSMCDGAAAVALEATRAARGSSTAFRPWREASFAWVPQTPSAAFPRTPAGE
jgi:hypothetical protein